MSLFKGLKTLGRVASKVANSPLGKVATMVPGLGTVMGAVGAAGTVYSGYQALTGGGGGGGGLPALPSGLQGPPLSPGGFAGGMPRNLPGTAGANPIIGKRSIFRDDPNIAAALQPFAISARFLRQSFRSPVKGYVVVRDAVGDPVALPKNLAMKYAGYRPAKKPPISVGEYQALKRADRTVKKVRKIMATVARVDKSVGKGGKVVFKKKGGSK